MWEKSCKFTNNISFHFNDSTYFSCNISMEFNELIKRSKVLDFQAYISLVKNVTKIKGCSAQVVGLVFEMFCTKSSAQKWPTFWVSQNRQRWNCKFLWHLISLQKFRLLSGKEFTFWCIGEVYSCFLWGGQVIKEDESVNYSKMYLLFYHLEYFHYYSVTLDRKRSACWIFQGEVPFSFSIHHIISYIWSVGKLQYLERNLVALAGLTISFFQGPYKPIMTFFVHVYSHPRGFNQLGPNEICLL